MLDTKSKGNLTELQCIIAFYQLGYKVSIPYGDNSRYDFIADIDGKLLKIQCKTSRLIDNDNSSGSIEFSTTSTRSNTTGNYRHNYKSQIDYFSTFWDGKCYLIPVEECGTASKKIRFDNPKNNQTKGITFAKDYELSVVINKIIKENLKH